MICMTAWDFVIGVLFGIVVSCEYCRQIWKRPADWSSNCQGFFFVVQNSRLRSIRAMHTGDTTMSAVRRPSLQRAYIREVSKQTTILRLQGVLVFCVVYRYFLTFPTGFLFFGTITYVEEAIRSLIEGPSWQNNPVQFLVLDLSLVAGVDMSSAEAFVRIQRLLAAKYVTLVFCGFKIGSSVGKALRSVDVLGADGVELFLTFSDAMECKWLSCVKVVKGVITNFCFFFFRDRKCISSSLVQVSKVGGFSYIVRFVLLLFRLSDGSAQHLISCTWPARHE